ncbi:hypothetical protein ACFE04_001664 [Oxalis oulophora]
MDIRCPRKLNFNAPLLSIRRPSDGDRQNKDGKTAAYSDRVPFSWEQAPGKPKYSTGDTISEMGEVETPRPKPPPGHWRPSNETSFSDHVEEIRSLNCHGDFENDHDDAFSDAMDVLSLTEAIDIVEKNGEEEKEEKNHHHRNGLEGFHMETSKHKSPSPSFIIQRFLPDAAALAAAASSTINLSRNFSKKLNYKGCSLSERRGVSQRTIRTPSLKGCGLELLFPWRTKNRLCGVKSPVVCQGYSVDVHPHCGSSQKKKC